MATRIVELKADFAGMVAVEQKLRKIPGATEKAIKRASKRAAAKGETQIRQSITKQSNIKSAIVKKKTKKGPSGKVGAFVGLMKSGRLGVRHFKAKHVQQGVKYQVGKKDKWLLIPGSFQGPWTQATKAFNKKGQKLKKPKPVFVPRPYAKWMGNAAVRVGKSRLPIVFIKGVSPAGFFWKRKLLKPSQKEIQDFFYKRLRHEIKFILMKKAKRV